ncbi:hypothetical protein CYY_002165 [Polysphondylium violaceum]|uniref:Phospholipase B-like n=1 Tax=Polysphondylium violaceum TaxID=133409 RepID=A0A8J4PYX7_9MYCE|nr:hypothetical protein CYY_002165 [Polysphondylium violaceum]
MKLINLISTLLFASSIVCVLSIDPKTFENQFNKDPTSPSQWYSLLPGNKVVPGENVTGSIAWGYFKDELFLDGWGKLSIETVSTVSDEIAFTGAGYLEGYLSWNQIYNFSVNYFSTFLNTTNAKEFPIEVVEFVSNNYQYMDEQVKAASPTDPYWIQVANAMSQLNGLYNGYNDATVGTEYQLSFLEIYMLNLYGDMGDIISATMSDNTEFTPLSRKDVEQKMATDGHCTALIKLAPNNAELYVAHTTWAELAQMSRIYKRIKIPVASTPYGSETLFASYPALLVSIDDFYMIRPSQLMLTETLNSLLNNTLYSVVTPNSFLYWVRNLVANRLSNSGFEWVNYFVPYNSGTNNIQFMIVDYKLFTPNQPIQPDTLWIVEQYPGGYVAADVSFSLIENSYWASYNRPYSQEVYDIMGYPYYYEKYGDLFSWGFNPRANIFRRDQGNIDSLQGMQSIISYNEYKTDPLSDGYPGNAIAARYDLKAPPRHPYSWFYWGPHGGIDGKVMNKAMFDSFTVLAINGPTVTDECPPFSWSEFPDVSHVGLPEVFQFSWVTINL